MKLENHLRTVGGPQTTFCPHNTIQDRRTAAVATASQRGSGGGEGRLHPPVPYLPSERLRRNAVGGKHLSAMHAYIYIYIDR